MTILPIRNKHKHHIIPKLLLKGFCEYEKENAYIWNFVREKPFSPGWSPENNNPFRTEVNSTAQFADFYTLITENGQEDSNIYENQLQKEETKCDTILRKILSLEPISIAEKVDFARYIQLTMKRVPARNFQNTPFANQVFNDISANMGKIGYYHSLRGDFKASSRAFSAKKYSESKAFKNRILNELMLKQYPNLHTLIVSMKWTFFSAPEGLFFVLPDSPISFDKSWGLKNSPFIFPISRNVALVATHTNLLDLQNRIATYDEAMAINFFLIICSNKIYSPRPEQWIWEILNNGLALNNEQNQFLRQMVS